MWLNGETLNEYIYFMQSVQRIILSHYGMYRCKIEDTPTPAKTAQTHQTDEATETQQTAEDPETGQTARELFEKTHAVLLKDAQE